MRGLHGTPIHPRLRVPELILMTSTMSVSALVIWETGYFADSHPAPTQWDLRSGRCYRTDGAT
jgi:hypothetical protein